MRDVSLANAFVKLGLPFGIVSRVGCSDSSERQERGEMKPKRNGGNGDEDVELSEKSDLSALNERQRAFVEAFTGPEHMGDFYASAKAAGYSDNYGYQLIRRGPIAEILEARREAKWFASGQEEGPVLAALIRRAKGDGAVANSAAEIFFKAKGRIGGDGPTFINEFNAGTSEPFGERLDRAERIRNAEVLSENEG